MKQNGKRMELHKLFLPWQDDSECAWLERMHRDGWALEATGFCRYRFIRCEGGTWSYRLDFRAMSANDEAEYLALFSAAGWERVGRGKGWHYFRHCGGADAPIDIYTDLQSRRRMYGAMLGFLALISLPSLYFVLLYPSRPNGLSGVWLELYGILKLVLGAILVLLALAALGIARRMSGLGKGVGD